MCTMLKSVAVVDFGGPEPSSLLFSNIGANARSSSDRLRLPKCDICPYAHQSSEQPCRQALQRLVISSGIFARRANSVLRAPATG